jgi:uncharacterized repeat protein (TIGR03803 family)
MSRSQIACLTGVALLTCSLLAPAYGVAQTYTDLHDFNCATDGCGPTYTSQLSQGRDGNLYGTASFGGTYGFGTVLKITPQGVVTTLHNFDGTDGYYPMGGLMLGADGNFYGTTQFDTTTAGTLFKITPSGVLTVLHYFAGGLNDGASPLSAPTLANDGDLYGATGVAEGTDTGIAYKYSASSGYTVLSTLTNDNPGSGFFAPLIQGMDGNLYSTTYGGGANESGTVYSLSSGGVATVIYNFDTTHGGWGYAPVVQDSQGNLFGTEAQGGTSSGGVVFRVGKSGNITTLYNFTNYCGGTSYGCVPAGGLVLASDGNLYGSTYRGGENNDGILFKITRSGVYSQEATLYGTDGAAIESTPIQHTNGTIYGVTFAGGAYGGGVLYSLNVGLKPFVALLFNIGKVGTSVGILGQGFRIVESVSFNGKSATFKVISNNYIVAEVPNGATSGFVTVKTSGQTLKSNRRFVVQ